MSSNLLSSDLASVLLKTFSTRQLHGRNASPVTESFRLLSHAAHSGVPCWPEPCTNTGMLVDGKGAHPVGRLQLAGQLGPDLLKT
eukprot:CAMPEP_0181536562 /NCGR_PEP_ID=MMETSP1110-20121109/74893_1 /TAXON_ID=174948 /ORGANISM="Symbiodinium sp., Strain CCMP421" /LENGTH=84 /DNA_ID=CAMNT_0023668093 /DNA_START=223 /DNA_END=477 /DNA_ORIENTATION=+